MVPESLWLFQLGRVLLGRHAVMVRRVAKDSRLDVAKSRLLVVACVAVLTWAKKNVYY